MAKDKRVEVLFEPQDYARLQQIAERERKSVGGVIRDAVAKYVTTPAEDEKRRRAFDYLTSTNTGIDWGTPEELKEFYGRTYSEAIMKSSDERAPRDEDGPNETH